MTKFGKRSQEAKGLEWSVGVSETTLLGDIGGKLLWDNVGEKGGGVTSVGAEEERTK